MRIKDIMPWSHHTGESHHQPDKADARHSLKQDINALVDRFVEKVGSFELPWHDTEAKSDVVQADKAVEISIELPGMGLEDIDLSISGDMLVVQGCSSGGGCSYDWSRLDTLYDGILAAGVTPIVELSFMPALLANCTGKTCHTMMAYKALTAFPKTWGAWGDLVGAFARHLVERHGIEIVKNVKFEVWNEMWGGFDPTNWSSTSDADAPYMALFSMSIVSAACDLQSYTKILHHEHRCFISCD